MPDLSPIFNSPWYWSKWLPSWFFLNVRSHLIILFLSEGYGFLGLFSPTVSCPPLTVLNCLWVFLSSYLAVCLWLLAQLDSLSSLPHSTLCLLVIISVLCLFLYLMSVSLWYSNSLLPFEIACRNIYRLALNSWWSYHEFQVLGIQACNSMLGSGWYSGVLKHQTMGLTCTLWILTNVSPSW